MKAFIAGVALTLTGLALLLIIYVNLLGMNWVAGFEALFSDEIISYPESETLTEFEADVLWLGEVENHRLNEVSGLAGGEGQTIYAINDSGNEPYLYGFDLTGEQTGEWRVEGMELEDWEDMAQLEIRGEPYLVIADVGDNLGVRDRVALLFIKVPGIDDLTVKPEWILTFSYPDGPRDCEAVAITPDGKNILLVSKRDPIPRVYLLPMSFESTDLIAEYLGLLETWPKLTERDRYQDPFWAGGRRMPTAMAMNEDSLVITTYGHAFIYGIEEGDWRQALSQSPLILRLPRTSGREAITFDNQGEYLITVNEREDGRDAADIFKVSW